MKTQTKIKLSFKKVGLVCSGGATKAAAFHVGVALALRDKGFRFIGGKVEEHSPTNACPYPNPKYHPHEISTYVGSSAGALITSMFASGIPIESLVNSFIKEPELKLKSDFPEIKKINYRDILSIELPRATDVIRRIKQTSILGKTLESVFLKNLRFPGFFSTRGLGNYLKSSILPSNEFNQLKADLFVVATQLDHSRKMIFGKYSTEQTYDEYSHYGSNVPISDAVAASMAMPVLFAPYLIKHEKGKERYYIDGEIRETLSTHVAKDNGCDLVICSYTHQPYHYQEKVGSLIDFGIPSILIQTIYQSIEQKIYNSKKNYEQKKLATRIVNEFFKEKKYPKADLEELMGRLEDHLNFNRNIHFLYIHPEARDQEMFFGDHFTLNPQILQSVVLIGYKRAMATLRRYDFAA